jgi:hypothetical protein
MKLTIGKRFSAQVASLEEASRIYCKQRDLSGEGASTFPEGKVDKYRISYNGKVWIGKWQAGMAPVFNPYAEVAA